MLVRLKEKVEFLLKEVAKRLLRVGVTPNILTAVGLCLSVVAAYFYAQPPALWDIWLAAGLLFLSGFCDALDGAMARIGNSITPFGGFLDSLLDRYSEAAVILGITLNSTFSPILGVAPLVWGLVAITGSILVSYTRARAESLDVQLAAVGLAERPERIMVLIVASVLLRPDLGVVAVAVLANFTVVQRGLHVYRKVKSKT